MKNILFVCSGNIWRTRKKPFNPQRLRRIPHVFDTTLTPFFWMIEAGNPNAWFNDQTLPRKCLQGVIRVCKLSKKHPAAKRGVFCFGNSRADNIPGSVGVKRFFITQQTNYSGRFPLRYSLPWNRLFVQMTKIQQKVSALMQLPKKLSCDIFKVNL